MFFLSSYGFICLASGIQKWSGIASYRPEFKTPTSVSFIGAVACLGIMFKLDMVAMIGATFAMLAVYWILQRRNFKSSPKDTWAGFWAAVVQKGLLKLHKNRRNSKNWRPNAIVFAGEPSERQHLINLTKWMVDTRGLATYFYLIEGDILLESKRADRLEPGVRETVGRLYPDMLTQVAVANDIYEGIINASQSYGLSGMKPNTVIMGWGDESESPAKFTNLVHSLMALDHNLIFVNYDENREFGYYEKIDIWWGGMNKNGDLMLLLGYLILSSEQWRKARINIYVVVDEENQKHNATESLTRIIEDSRVKATAKVIVRESKDKKISTIMSEVSGESDLVIMGLREPKSDEAETFIEYVSGYTESLGTVMLVHSSTKFEGASVLFDEE
jgi:hypothetical protein